VSDCDFVNSRVQIYPNFITHPQEPRHVHIDLAYAKDSAGIAVGYVFKFTEINRGDHLETLTLIQLESILEGMYKDMVDFEFTVQDNKLYILQARVGKRSAQSAFTIALDLVKEQIIDIPSALSRLIKEQFKTLRRPRI